MLTQNEGGREKVALSGFAKCLECKSQGKTGESEKTDQAISIYRNSYLDFRE